MNSFRALGLSAALLSVFFATPAAAARNVAPVITGTPATSVVGGNRYTFRATATDANHDRIRFAMYRKPSWGTFDQRTGVFTGIAPLGLNATFSNIVVSASDGRLSSSLPPFSITVTSATTNSAPVISGSPATSVLTSTPYSFVPTASDADGDAVAFSISNKPSWATFSTATGKLSGTPAFAQIGTYLSIVISVSDGQASAALPSFAITVNPPPATGAASLSWTAPTQNTDGSQLTDLAGYRVYHGTSPDTLDQMTQLPGAGTTTYVFNQLATGTHYFAVAAYNIGGVESALSGIGSKTIP